MKKTCLLAALAAMALTSCMKDGGKGDPARLTIKLAGVVSSETRAVDGPALTAKGTITLTNGHIFIIDTGGAVTDNEPLNVTQASNGGQTFPREVPVNSRVFILGNIPSADQTAVAALTSLTAINAFPSDIASQSNYKKVVLSNSNGAPADITVSGATATAEVSIKPVIARVELESIKSTTDITAFTVEGVYLDGYYPSFTYGGSRDGAKFTQGSSTTFTGIGDRGPWTATGTSPDLTAKPTDNAATADVVEDRWAHNVAADALPMFIIHLTGVGNNASPSVTTSGDQYLTMSKYNGLGAGVTTFERGKIYRLSDLTFSTENLDVKPNASGLTLTATVEIDEWVVVTPSGELEKKN